MSKIKSLQVNLPMHNEFYIVGRGRECSHIEHFEGIITEIKDVGVEFENSIHCFYEIYLGGKLFKRIENTPVTLEYEVN